MANLLSRWQFIKGAESQNGLAGYLERTFQAFGVVSVASGTTSIAVAYAQIKASDIVMVTLATKGTNACVVVSTTIVAGTGFTITVDTDPGAGGAVYNYAILRPTGQ